MSARVATVVRWPARSAGILAFVIALAGGLGIAREAQAQPAARRNAPATAPRRVAPGDFPHARHVRLFPTCAGCHRDVAGTTTADLFPPAASCATCHDGTALPAVIWSPPPRPAAPGLLDFSHGAHFAATDTASRECAGCHRGAGTSEFMNVQPARGESCFGCHAHRTPGHYDVATPCATCHRPLARATAIPAARLRSLPRPPSHELPGFGAAHGPTNAGQQAQCATCHARESCARCHLNAAAVPSIAALAADRRVRDHAATLGGSWPVPASHRDSTFRAGHGPAAAAAQATCATCHARSSCTSCHVGRGAAAVIRRLVEPASGPRGVMLQRVAREGPSLRIAMPAASLLPPLGHDTTGVRRVRPHPPDFRETHRAVAASGELTCEGCHSRRFCSDCHAGESRRDFHPANFVARHGAPTYARDRDCASCHNPEVFCRGCHQATGLASGGGNPATFHNAQPQWLLQHGRAARLELATCTSCHTQTSCMRCHATTGWGVNPHGANLSLDRLGRTAMTMCARCHIRDPRRDR